MEKLRKLLEKIIDFGKLPKNCSLVDVDILFSVYNELARHEYPEFISLNVKNILEKCGIMTAQRVWD